jgi:dihydrofolate reductase
MWDDVGRITAAADTAVYGRVTYRMMESYWPTAATRPGATRHDVDHATWLDAATKILVSRTVASAPWRNTVVLQKDVVGALTAMKQQPGKNLVMIGSANLAATLVPAGLVDEFWLNVNPVVLGRGLPLFKVDRPQTLALLDYKAYHNGVLALHYARAPGGN